MGTQPENNWWRVAKPLLAIVCWLTSSFLVALTGFFLTGPIDTAVFEWERYADPIFLWLCFYYACGISLARVAEFLTVNRSALWIGSLTLLLPALIVLGGVLDGRLISPVVSALWVCPTFIMWSRAFGKIAKKARPQAAAAEVAGPVMAAETAERIGIHQDTSPHTSSVNQEGNVDSLLAWLEATGLRAIASSITWLDQKLTEVTGMPATDLKPLKAVVIGAVALIGLWVIWPRGASPAVSVTRALRQAKELRSVVPANASVSEYVSRLRGINTSDCPKDFRACFLSHVHAWEAAVEMERRVQAFNAEKNSLMSMVEAFYRGAMGDPLGKAFDDRAGDKALEQRASSVMEEIRRTYQSMEQIAIQHGAQLP
jgi:hypothetical protein